MSPFQLTSRSAAGLLPLLIGLAIALSSCDGDESPVPPTPRQALAEGRRLWQAAALGDYTYRLTRTCFCSSDVALPLDIRVSSGRVTECWRDPGHRLFALELGLSVDSLFVVIERALDAGYETVDVTYDSRLGYPVQFNLDKAGVADEELAGSALLFCREAPLDPATHCDCAGEAGTLVFDFTALDTVGVAIVRGCLGLRFTPGNVPSTPETIRGNRCLRGLCTPGIPSMFVGEWGVDGRLEAGGALRLDLNREIRDANIALLAHYDDPSVEHGSFSGSWSYNTFTGSQARGTFTATRVP